MIVYFLLGCMLTFYIQKEHIFKILAFTPWLQEMRKCWKCTSFWVFFLTWPFFQVSVFGDIQYMTGSFVQRDGSIHMEILWGFVLLVYVFFQAVMLSLLSFYLKEGVEKNHSTVILLDNNEKV